MGKVKDILTFKIFFLVFVLKIIVALIFSTWALFAESCTTTLLTFDQLANRILTENRFIRLKKFSQKIDIIVGTIIALFGIYKIIYPSLPFSPLVPAALILVIIIIKIIKITLKPRIFRYMSRSKSAQTLPLAILVFASLIFSYFKIAIADGVMTFLIAIIFLKHATEEIAEEKNPLKKAYKKIRFLVKDIKD